MSKKATLFERTNQDIIKAYLKHYRGGRNVPPAWIERYRFSRKNTEKEIAMILGKRKINRKDLSVLKEWATRYRKEWFYQGIRALLELERKGKTKI
jgi:hypothetical protein